MIVTRSNCRSWAESDARILPDSFAVFSGFSGHRRSEEFVLLNPLPGGSARDNEKIRYRGDNIVHKNTTISWLVSGVSLALLSSMVMAAAPNTTTVRQVITGLSPFPCAPTSNAATSHPILNSEDDPELDAALNPASPLSTPIV